MLTSEAAGTDSATKRGSAETVTVTETETGAETGTGAAVCTETAETGSGSAAGDTGSAAAERTPARRGAHGGIMVTRVGLELPAVLEFGVWEQAGLKIARIADSSAWCLGDWLIYGQNLYADRYRHAVAMAGLDYQTLRNYAWVARRFELCRRRERLSFQHHAEVAALSVADQDRWLDRAEQGGWSRNQLRSAIRAERRPAARAAIERPGLPRLCPAAEQVGGEVAAGGRATESGACRLDRRDARFRCAAGPVRAARTRRAVSRAPRARRTERRRRGRRAVPPPGQRRLGARRHRARLVECGEPACKPGSVRALRKPGAWRPSI